MPPQESERIAQAAADLESVGYVLVEREATTGRPGSKVRADLIAYGPNSEDEVAPVVLVEVKSRRTSAESVLAQMASLANLFGTELNYIFDGAWHKASTGFNRLIEVPGPEPARPIGPDTRTPDRTFYSWLSRDLWHRADQLQGSRFSWLPLLSSVLSDKPGSQSPDTALWRSAGTSAFWAVQRLAAERQPIQTGEYFLPKDLASGLAKLLAAGDRATVFDPFCGAGSTLWATREEAAANGWHVSIEGYDRNETNVDLANAFASLIGAEDARFTTRDWFQEPENVEDCDYLVSAPPMGSRLPAPVTLPWGNESTDGDVAILARAASSLRPSGRAVLLMSRKVLSSGGASARIREWLSTHARVAAMIGLPPGVLTSTGIPTVILVIENKPPTETLVAELQDDWARQLSSSGAFMVAYREHTA